jgi:hypothetical protein
LAGPVGRVIEPTIRLGPVGTPSQELEIGGQMQVRAGMVLMLFATALVGAAPGDVEPKVCPTKSWLGREAEVEKLLETAEVTSVKDVGSGVTHPKRVELTEAGVAFSGAFKPIKAGRYSGYWESYQAEIAAYRLDTLLGFGMVPPTVERRIEGRKGSLQFWVEGCKLYRDMPKQGPPAELQVQWNEQVATMKLFDTLIANRDRNAQNFMVDGDWHIVLIDHSRAFIGDKKLDLRPTSIPSHFSRRIVDRLRAVGPEEVEKALGDLLMGDQMKGFLERRKALLALVDQAVAEKGDAAVYF